MDCCTKYKNSFINRLEGGEMLRFVQQFPIRGGGMKEMLYLVQDFIQGITEDPTIVRKHDNSSKTALK